MGPLKNVARLTSGRVESLKPRDHRCEINDPACAGLQLRVSDTGAKSWRWRFYWHGKRARLVLGVWPKTSLAAAHEKAEAARALLRRGIDPRRGGLTVAPRKRPDKPTEGGPQGIRSSTSPTSSWPGMSNANAGGRNASSGFSMQTMLPRWGSRDARTIKPREVIELLDEIADRAPVMANRVAGILSQMFRFGIHRSIVETTPVQLLYRPGGKEKPRARVFSEAELKAFITNLDDACRFQRLPHVPRSSSSPCSVAASSRSPNGASSTSPENVDDPR